MVNNSEKINYVFFIAVKSRTKLDLTFPCATDDSGTGGLIRIVIQFDDVENEKFDECRSLVNRYD